MTDPADDNDGGTEETIDPYQPPLSDEAFDSLLDQQMKIISSLRTMDQIAPPRPAPQDAIPVDKPLFLRNHCEGIVYAV